jgi:hypothetical protein
VVLRVVLVVWLVLLGQFLSTGSDILLVSVAMVSLVELQLTQDRQLLATHIRVAAGSSRHSLSE